MSDPEKKGLFIVHSSNQRKAALSNLKETRTARHQRIQRAEKRAQNRFLKGNESGLVALMDSQIVFDPRQALTSASAEWNREAHIINFIKSRFANVTEAEAGAFKAQLPAVRRTSYRIARDLIRKLPAGAARAHVREHLRGDWHMHPEQLLGDIWRTANGALTNRECFVLRNELHNLRDYAIYKDLRIEFFDLKQPIKAAA